MPVIGQPAHTHFIPIVSPVVLTRVSLSRIYLYNNAGAAYRVTLSVIYRYDIQVIVSRPQTYLYHVNPVLPGPTRLYFHQALNPLSNLPDMCLCVLIPDKFVDPETTNRLMNTIIGPLQKSLVLTSNAVTGIQRYFFSRFVSETFDSPFSLQANSWTYNFASSSSAAGARFPVNGLNQPVRCVSYVWRPTTGLKVGDIIDANSNPEIDSFSSLRSHICTYSGNQVLDVQAGDVLVFEVLFEINQGVATAFTDNFFYDGAVVTTTENLTVSNHATFIQTPQGLSFGAALVRISKSCVYKYDIIDKPRFSQTYRYDVTLLTSLSSTYPYAITERVSLSRSYLYNMRGRLSAPSVIKYNILVRKLAPKIFRYSLQSTLETSRNYNYDITTALATSRIYRYNLFNRATLSRIYRYPIYKAVSLSRIYRYSINARAALSRLYRYNIANRITNARIYRYGLAVKLSLSRLYRYNLTNLRSASSHVRYSILSKLSVSKIFRYGIAIRVTLSRLYKYSLNSFSQVSLSSIYKYNITSRRSLSRIYGYAIATKLSLVRAYLYNLTVRATLSRIYRYNVLKASVSLSTKYVYDISTVPSVVRWQLTGKDTDFPDSLENLVRDYIKTNWSITDPVIGQTPIITTVISRQHQSQVDNFAYDAYRTYYIRVKEVQSEVKNRQVRLNTYEFETPLEVECYSRRLKKGENFLQLNAMVNELLRIFGTYQAEGIFGVQGITLDRISSMEKERPPAQNIWARRLRIILHYYRVSVVG